MHYIFHPYHKRKFIPYWPVCQISLIFFCEGFLFNRNGVSWGCSGQPKKRYFSLGDDSPLLLVFVLFATTYNDVVAATQKEILSFLLKGLLKIHEYFSQINYNYHMITQSNPKTKLPKTANQRGHCVSSRFG